MLAVASKKRAGRGSGGAHHEVAVLVRFTSEQDNAIREAADWTGAQLAHFIREAAVRRAREVLSEKAALGGPSGAMGPSKVRPPR